MRRISLAVLVLVVSAVTAPLRAQSQDTLITSARQVAQQGAHDSAIAMLRGGLATRPNDEALKKELLGLLMLKQNALREQVAELGREIAALRGPLPVKSSISASGVPASAPVRVGGEVKVPMKLRDVRPMYPIDAQQARVQGIVIVEATIDTEGNVADASVLRGQPLLNEAALEAVRQWRYQPTLLNGVPVPVIMTVTVTFTLRD